MVNQDAMDGNLDQESTFYAEVRGLILTFQNKKRILALSSTGLFEASPNLLVHYGIQYQTKALGMVFE